MNLISPYFNSTLKKELYSTTILEPLEVFIFEMGCNMVGGIYHDNLQSKRLKL